ncbi:MAG: RT0821/Lpp0805 family surface protein [Rhodopila sp.]|nr:RT0821/Lpp0805 family surface protein [Rhodopila sp.]
MPARQFVSNARLSKSWCAIFVLLGLLIAVWPTDARAQINPFRGYKGPVLPKEDLEAGQAAARKLLTEDQAQVGKAEAWTGPKSGNQGTVSVLRAFKRQGMDCRALKSEVRYREDSSSPRTLNLNVCRLPSGEWKLM